MPRSYGTTNAVPYSTAPPVGAPGDTYWNTTNNTLYVSSGSAWVPWPTGGGGWTNPTVRQINSNTTLNNRDIAEVDCTSGSITITLPVAAGNEYTVKRVDGTANTLTVVPASGNIDGDANAYLVGQWTSAIFVANGTNVRVRATYGIGQQLTYYERVGFTAQVLASAAATGTQISPLVTGTLLGNVPSMFNLSAGTWTCAIAGTYLVTASLKFVTGWVVNSPMALFAPKNGQGRTYSLLSSQGAVYDPQQTIGGAVDFAVGETLQLNARQTSGANQTIDNANVGTFWSMKLLG